MTTALPTRGRVDTLEPFATTTIREDETPIDKLELWVATTVALVFMFVMYTWVVVGGLHPGWLFLTHIGCAGSFLLLGLSFGERKREERLAYQVGGWLFLAGPFGAAIALLVVSAAPPAVAEIEDFGAWVDEVSTDDKAERIAHLQAELEDNRLRLKDVDDVRPLREVFEANDQGAKFRALSAVVRNFDPSLSAPLRTALNDKDPAVRVMASGVLTKLQESYADRISKFDPPENGRGKKQILTLDDRLELGIAHFEFGESGLLNNERRAQQFEKARRHFVGVLKQRPDDEEAREKLAAALDWLGTPMAALTPDAIATMDDKVEVVSAPAKINKGKAAKSKNLVEQNFDVPCSEEADICLILEGAYPFVKGGVSAWTDSLIEAAPHLTFNIVSLLPDSKIPKTSYRRQDNVLGMDTIDLSGGMTGEKRRGDAGEEVEKFGDLLERLILDGNTGDLVELKKLLTNTQFGEQAFLDSEDAWMSMCDRYRNVLPDAPLMDFFWTYRVLSRAYQSIVTAKIPKAKAYHVISTGYAGVLAAQAKLTTGRPVAITEHGIYTNERRVEVGLSKWLYNSGVAGFSTDARVSELTDVWQRAFSSMAKLSYDNADIITTLYTGNQNFQLADGADPDKLRVIPNGVDFDLYSNLPSYDEDRPPTVGFIGRVVPIKDVVMFVHAIASLKKRVPNVRALVLGPDDEDEEYAGEVHKLVEREGLTDCIQFLGFQKPKDWLNQIDVVVLTSISEAQPLVLLEAGAAGVPSVATDVGSCRDLLEGFDDDPTKGQGGFVVGVGDSLAAADAMEKLLTDEDMRHRMGEIMRARVEHYYNRTIVDRVYNDMYAGLISRPTIQSNKVES